MKKISRKERKKRAAKKRALWLELAFMQFQTYLDEGLLVDAAMDRLDDYLQEKGRENPQDRHMIVAAATEVVKLVAEKLTEMYDAGELHDREEGSSDHSES